MYRDDLLAAQARVLALERELNQRVDHSLELKKLRGLLSRFRLERMPRDMRLLHLGTVAALLATGYLLLAMSLLPLLGSRLYFPLESAVFLPWVGPTLFGVILLGLRGLIRESFDGTASWWLVVTFFGLALLTPLLPLQRDVMLVTEAFTWAAAQLTFGYVIARCSPIPRPLAFAIAIACLASALFGGAGALNNAFWEPYIYPWTALYQQGAMKLLAASLASSAVGTFLITAAFHSVRAKLMTRHWREAQEEPASH